MRVSTAVVKGMPKSASAERQSSLTHRVAHSGMLAGLAFGCLVGPKALASQTVGDDLACSKCVIQIRQQLKIGDPDGPGALAGKPHSVVEDRLGRFWVTAPPTMPAVYDRNGRFLRLVGARGRGPGEFTTPSYVSDLPNDSVVIFDWSQRRAVVIGPDFNAKRHIQLPSSMWRWGMNVAAWPDRIVVSALLSSGTAAGWPLHELSFRSDKAEIVSSFGPNEGAMRPQEVFHLGQRISRPQGGNYWTIEDRLYRLSQWTRGGARLKQLERRPSWFAGPSNLRPGDHDTPPSPTGAALFEDERRRVWAFTEIAAPDWQSAWNDVPRIKGSESRESSAARGPAFSKLYRTMIEVIDPRVGRVMARSSLNHMQVVSVLSGNRVVVYSLDLDDQPFLSVVQVVLVGN